MMTDLNFAKTAYEMLAKREAELVEHVEELRKVRSAMAALRGQPEKRIFRKESGPRTIMPNGVTIKDAAIAALSQVPAAASVIKSAAEVIYGAPINPSSIYAMMSRMVASGEINRSNLGYSLAA